MGWDFSAKGGGEVAAAGRHGGRWVGEGGGMEEQFHLWLCWE